MLGPLLFILYINDLPNGLNKVSKFFADDLKLIVNASDKQTILDDISILEKWESIWLLKFNPEKVKSVK